MYKIVQEKIDKTLKKARSLSRTDVLAAIQTYYQILFLNKNHLPSYLELSALYTQIGDLSPAIACLQYSLAIKQDILVEDELHQILIMRGTALLEQGDINNFLEGTEYEQFGNYVDYNNQQLKIVHAFILTNYLNYAFTEIQKIIEKDSTNWEAILLRAKLYFALGKPALGNLDYWNVNNMQPDVKEVEEFKLFITPKVNNIVAEAKLNLIQKENDRCLLNIKKGLELEPHNSDLLLMRAYQYRINRDYEQSLKSLDQALKQDMQNKDIKRQIAITYNEMAMFLFQRNNYDDALTLFTEALKYKSDDWGILINRGDTYKCLNQLNESLSDYRAAYEIEKNETIAQRLAIILHSFGVDFFNKKMFQKAYESFTQALELNESIDILYKRGKCLLQMQEHRMALSDFERILELNPEHYEALIIYKQLSGLHKQK